MKVRTRLVMDRGAHIKREVEVKVDVASRDRGTDCVNDKKKKFTRKRKILLPPFTELKAE